MNSQTSIAPIDVLLVEADRELAAACRRSLQAYELNVVSANLSEALALLSQTPCRTAVLAARSNDGAMARALQRWPAMPVLWVQADSDEAVPEPVSLRGLLEQISCAQLNKALQRQFAVRPVEPVSRSSASRKLLQLAARVAQSDATVLISGESGVGKEVLAKFIHRQSARANRPWVAINCAAIPDTLLEAELFGHERGAFSGAIMARPGKLETADGGTVLLDEISEMPVSLQAKLLRVLQEGEVARLGSNQSRSLDLRIIATSNRNLIEEVSAGRFREDLYYRLTVLPLHIKPLRLRRDDLLPLALHLLAQRTEGQLRRRLSDPAMDVICAHHWPGNVRELANTMARALIFSSDTDIDGATMAAAVHPLPASQVHFDADLEQTRRHAESHRILRALHSEQGSRRLAAEQLGISQRTLRYKLARMKEDGIAIPG